jgi:hypothetical protein
MTVPAQAEIPAPAGDLGLMPTSATRSPKRSPSPTPTPDTTVYIQETQQPPVQQAAAPNVVAHVQHVVDFDGDGKTDFSIIRDLTGDPVTGQAQWWTQPSSNPNIALVQNWGLASDQFLAGDYDGDHKTDYAIWRGPDNGVHAAFWILRSSDGTASIVPFGLGGDNPLVVGDYDGDGKDDVAVFRSDPNPADPTQPTEWWFRPSGGPDQGLDVIVQWGLETDIPVPGDYNGDGKADLAIARQNDDGTETMWIRYGDGTFVPNAGQSIVRWGLNTDFYVPGDYDGDGKTDLAIVRDTGTNLQWWVQWSSDNSVHITTWGLSGDLMYAVQGDYDGDGKTDIGVWRPSDATFYIIASSTGSPIYMKWGIANSSSDTPTASFNEH